jgi:hypothetical protein
MGDESEEFLQVQPEIHTEGNSGHMYRGGAGG